MVSTMNHDETKQCIKCGEEKNLEDFYHKRSYKDGHLNTCKKCSNYYESIRRKNNIEKHRASDREKMRRYYKNNREALIKKNREWRKNNPEKAKEVKKKNYQKYREKNLVYSKDWASKNKEKRRIAFKKRYAKNKDKIRIGNRRRNVTYYQRKKNDSAYKLNRNISRGISNGLKGKKNGCHWKIFVDYTIDDLKKYLMRLMKKYNKLHPDEKDMSWDNYGEWHVDHKIPKSVFNFTKPEHTDFQRCWALSNLQPMWASENIAKSNKINKHFQPSLLI